jgi:hypothetical protein
VTEQLAFWSWLEGGAGSGGGVVPAVPEVTGPRVRLLEEKVALGVGLPVRLVVTNNRHTLVSWRPVHGGQAGYVVRVHRMFLEAPDPVALSLGRYVARGDREDGRVLDAYMEGHVAWVTRRRRALCPPRGRVHDLSPIQAGLNATEFGGTLQARIGWGEPGMPRRRHRTTMQLGCHDALAGTISIHPALDQAFVPAWFVTSVVFHEMLHEAIPATRVGDRRSIHPPAFRARLEQFPLTAPAREWERRNLDLLLAYRPRPRGASVPGPPHPP